MAYDMANRKKKKSSSRKPIPPAKGSSKQSQGRSRQGRSKRPPPKGSSPSRVSDIGIVQQSNPPAIGPGGRAAMSGAGTVATFANLPVVGVPLSAGAAFMDTADARASKKDLIEQGTMSNAYLKQRSPDSHLMYGHPDTVAKWDATYDDPRRKAVDDLRHPETGEKITPNEAHYWMVEIDKAERERHPIRQEAHDLRSADREVLKAHTKSMRDKTKRFDDSHKQALASTAALGVSGLSGGDVKGHAGNPFAAPSGSITGTGLGWTNPVTQGVMPYATGQAAHLIEDQASSRIGVPLLASGAGLTGRSIPKRPRSVEPNLRKNMSANTSTFSQNMPTGGNKF